MNDKTLVIVESPTKAKTIGKMLNANYTVLSSRGHIYELIKKENAVDPNNNFEMHYQTVEKNAKTLSEIVSAAKKSEILILATDPDREGEAIAWHVCEHLKEKKSFDHLKTHRCTFHQITKKAILAAIDSPKEINMDLVNAQQTRRAMDFLLGFNLSPLLWRTVKPGTSAGRVQSPALNLIVSREKERLAFEKEEYWSIHCKTQKPELNFSLHSIGEDRLDKMSISSEDQANIIVNDAKQNKTGTITEVLSRTRARKPKAPFTTSTLQQAAANRLGFPTSKTMKVAQELYEGISINGDQIGLITYMRTDSVTIAPEAIEQMQAQIKSAYGPDYLPNAPQQYTTKTKNAQEAHEAIRPSHFELTPQQVKKSLTPDQFKLYQLIWAKAISSQMVPAQVDTTTFTLSLDQHHFKVSGSVIKFPGFLAAYQDTEKEQESTLPQLNEGDTLTVESIEGQQHFTEPPARYSEASLVKALEELGIGRPSTYAAIISTLKKRAYVEVDKKQFVPTDVADVVIKFLTMYFANYVDYKFTAHMEDALDNISRGEEEMHQLLSKFWDELHAQVEKVGSSVKRSDVTHEKLDEKCPECNSDLVLKLGRHGKFIGCSTYPECNYTRPLDGQENNSEPLEDKPCPKCQSPMVKKQSAGGGFYGCSNYPECKHLEPLEENLTGIECPKCQKHDIIRRRSKRGKIFYGCAGFPKCKYALWNPPLKQSCPECNWPILTEKTLKSGVVISCPECEHKVTDDKKDTES